MPTTTKYLWSNGNIIAEADGNDTINVVYTYEPQQYGNLISTQVSGTTYYHHYDALGSTRQLTNASGTVTDRMTYDAWGNVVSRTGTTPVSMLWIGELGYYYDIETGASAVRARPYLPASARWCALDPIAFFDGVNRFRYSRNSPVVYIDPSGLSSGGASGNGPPFYKFLNGSCEGCIVVFFLGEGGDPTDKKSGMYIAAGDVKDQLDYVATARCDKDGAQQTEFDRVITMMCPSTTVRPSTKICVVLAGHSYGGDKAIAMADWFATEIPKLCPSRTAIISLAIIDAIQRKNTTWGTDKGPTTTPPILDNFVNYYQSNPVGGLVKLNGVPITKPTLANKNLDVFSPTDLLGDWMRATGVKDSYHGAIDNYVAESAGAFEGTTLGKWAQSEATRLQAAS